jgi:hypothetical protein
MDSNFISIKEAGVLVGKSEKTIRRWVDKCLDIDQTNVQASDQTVSRQRVDKIQVQTHGKNKVYLIEKGFLLESFGLDKGVDSDQTESGHVSRQKGGHVQTNDQTNQDLVDTLKATLETLNKQLETKDSQILELNQRLKEASQSLQFEQGKNKELQGQVLALKEPETPDDLGKNKPQGNSKETARKKPPKKAKQGKPKQPPKKDPKSPKNWLSELFGRWGK